MTNRFQVIRTAEVLELLKISKTAFYARLKLGLLPPQISLGSRAVGFLKHEYEDVLTAFIAGKSDAEIKLLVKEIVKRRK